MSSIGPPSSKADPSCPANTHRLRTPSTSVAVALRSGFVVAVDARDPEVALDSFDSGLVICRVGLP